MLLINGITCQKKKDTSQQTIFEHLWILNTEMETLSFPAFLIGCLTGEDCSRHSGADVVIDREPKVETF